MPLQAEDSTPDVFKLIQRDLETLLGTVRAQVDNQGKTLDGVARTLATFQSNLDQLAASSDQTAAISEAISKRFSEKGQFEKGFELIAKVKKHGEDIAELQLDVAAAAPRWGVISSGLLALGGALAALVALFK